MEFVRRVFLLPVLGAVSVLGSFAMDIQNDSIRKSSTRWVSQLIDNGFSFGDSSIYYPAFPRFILGVYNWGDRTFNSYDKDYVVGTGKNWKLQGKTYSWMESQTLFFPKNSQIAMHSNLFMDAGVHISFMAVSLGFTSNINKLFDRDTKRNTFNLDFACSRFSINYASLSSEGGMILTRFGDYNEGREFRYHFDDTKVNSATIDAYYFFNHNRYSHAAAYSFSKYQLRSSGTAVVGVNLAEQNFYMDFSNLPEEMLEGLPMAERRYNLHHRDIAVLGGYGYNWALKPKRWLLNLTAMGAIGYKRTYEDATDGERSLVANNYKLSFSTVYNHRKLFASGQLRFNGYLYYNSNFTHFSTFSSLTLTVGMRF